MAKSLNDAMIQINNESNPLISPNSKSHSSTSVLSLNDAMRHLDFIPSETPMGKGGDTNIVTGQYDFQPIIGMDNDARRGYFQSGIEQVGKTLANMPLNIVGGLLRDAGHIYNLATQWGDNRTYDNALITGADQLHNVFGEVYRKNPDKVFDFGDVAWYTNNLGQVAESVGTFAIEGWGLGRLLGMIGTTLGKGLANSTKLIKALDAANDVNYYFKNAKMLESINAVRTETDILRSQAKIMTALLNAPVKASHFINSFALAYIEGAQIAKDVYHDTYNNAIKNMSVEDAKHLASQAASTTAMINTTLIGFTNLAVLAPLVPKGLSLKARPEALKLLKGETAESALTRIKRVLDDPNLRKEALNIKTLKSLVAKESAQEFIEESVINNFAEYQGRYQGGISKKYNTNSTENPEFTQDYFKGLKATIFSQQSLLEGILGAIGGAGQSLILGGIVKTPVYDDSGKQVGKATGYQQENNLKLKFANRLVDNLEDDVNTINEIKRELAEIENDGSYESNLKREVLLRKMASPAILQSVMNGTGDLLINTYKQFAALDNTVDLGIEAKLQLDEATKELATLNAKKATEPSPELDAQIEFITAKVKDRTIKYDALNGQTAAMRAGVTESIDDNSYITKADDVVKLITELNGVQEVLESAYDFDVDSQLSGYAKVIYGLTLQKLQANLNLSHHDQLTEKHDKEIRKINEHNKEISVSLEAMNNNFRLHSLNYIIDKLESDYKEQPDKRTRKAKALKQVIEDTKTQRTELEIIAAQVEAKKQEVQAATINISEQDAATRQELANQKQEYLSAYNLANTELHDLSKATSRKEFITNWKKEVELLTARAKEYAIAKDLISIINATPSTFEAIKQKVDMSNEKVKEAIAKKQKEFDDAATTAAAQAVTATETTTSDINPVTNVQSGNETTVATDAYGNIIDTLPDNIEGLEDISTETVVIDDAEVPTFDNQNETEEKEEVQAPSIVPNILNLDGIPLSDLNNVSSLISDALEILDIEPLPNDIDIDIPETETSLNMLDSILISSFGKTYAQLEPTLTSDDLAEKEFGSNYKNIVKIIKDISITFKPTDISRSVDLTAKLPGTYSFVNSAIVFGKLLNAMSLTLGENTKFNIQDVIDFINSEDNSIDTTIQYAAKILSAARTLKNQLHLYVDEHAVYAELFNRFDFNNFNVNLFNLPKWAHVENIISNEEYQTTLSLFATIKNEYDTDNYLPLHNFLDGVLDINDNQAALLSNMLFNPEFGKNVIIRLDTDYSTPDTRFDYESTKTDSARVPVGVFDKVTGLKIGQVVTQPYIMKGIVHALNDYWWTVEDTLSKIKENYSLLYELYKTGKFSQNIEENWKTLMIAFKDQYNVHRGKGSIHDILDYTNVEHQQLIKEALLHIAKVALYGLNLNTVIASDKKGDFDTTFITNNLKNWTDVTNAQILHVKKLRQHVLQESFTSSISSIKGGTILKSQDVNKSKTPSKNSLDKVIAVVKDGKVLTDRNERIKHMPFFFRPYTNHNILVDVDNTESKISKGTNDTYKNVAYVGIQSGTEIIRVPVNRNTVNESTNSEQLIDNLIDTIEKALIDIRSSNNLVSANQTLRTILHSGSGTELNFTFSNKSKYKTTQGEIIQPEFELRFTENGQTKAIKIVYDASNTFRLAFNTEETINKINLSATNRKYVTFTSSFPKSNKSYKEAFKTALGLQQRSILFNIDNGFAYQGEFTDPVNNKTYPSYKHFLIDSNAISTNIAAYTLNGVPVSNVGAIGYDSLTPNIKINEVNRVTTLKETKVKPVSSKEATDIEYLNSIGINIETIDSPLLKELTVVLNSKAKVIKLTENNIDEIYEKVKDKLKINKETFIAVSEKGFVTNVYPGFIFVSKATNGVIAHELIHDKLKQLTVEEKAALQVATVEIMQEVQVAYEAFKLTAKTEEELRVLSLVANWIEYSNKSFEEAYTNPFEYPELAQWLNEQQSTTTNQSLFAKFLHAILKVFIKSDSLLNKIISTLEAHTIKETTTEVETTIVIETPTANPNAIDIDLSQDLYTISTNEIIFQKLINNELTAKCGF